MAKTLTSVFVSTYSFIKNGVRTNNSGPVKPLMNYFTRFPDVTLYVLEQPLPGCDNGQILFRKYKGREKQLEVNESVPFTPTNHSTLSNNKTYIRLKFRDLFSNFMMTSRYQDGCIDLYIGLECINACFGALQKRRGLYKDTVYYIFDWAPDRYANPFFNAAYLWLDKMASYHCDYTWNITDSIGEARVALLHYDKDRMSPQLSVPYSYDYDPDNILPDNEIDPNLILYAGGLIEENGSKLLVEGFAIVAGKFPKARLRIIGGGNDEPTIRKRLDELGLNARYEMTGFIADEAEVLRLQKRAGIAVAPYPNMRGSRKPYGDVIKIRMYFACGLPVVSTPVPPVTKEIKEEKLGMVTVDDSARSIADAIGFYLANPENLFSTRKRVARKASKSNWHDNYTHALEEMGYLL